MTGLGNTTESTTGSGGGVGGRSIVVGLRYTFKFVRSRVAPWLENVTTKPGKEYAEEWLCIMDLESLQQLICSVVCRSGLVLLPTWQ